MDFFIAIALLCQVPNGVSGFGYPALESKHLECQQYYIKCTEETPLLGATALTKCIKERKI